MTRRGSATIAGASPGVNCSITWRENMFRLLTLPLTAALCGTLLTVALDGQAPQGARGQGPAGAQGRGGGRGQVQLPDGEGKEAVTAACGACHGLNTITGSAGYTQAQWRDL